MHATVDRWWKRTAVVGVCWLTWLHLAALSQLPTHLAFGDDNSIYLVSALSLAHGQGYRLINYPAAPPATLYPIGYPFLLSLIFRLAAFGPMSIAMASGLSVVASLLWLLLSYRLLMRYVSSGLAAGLVVAVASFQPVVQLENKIHSDAVFAMVLAALLLLAKKIVEERSPDKRLAVCLGILLAACLLTRSVALSLMLAVPLALLINRLWSQSLTCAATAIAVCTPWFAWCWQLRGGNYYAYTAFFLNNPYRWTAWQHNVRTIVLDWLPALFVVSVWPLGLALACVMGVGLLSLLRKRDPCAICLVWYMGLVVLWPWEPSRFTVPALPALAICLIEGTAALARRKPQPWLPAIPLLLAAYWLMVDADWLRHPHAGLGALKWTDLSNAMAKTASEIPRDALIVSSYPYGVFLFTGRQTLQQPNGNEMAELLSRFRGRDVYVLATERYNFENQEFGLAPVRQFDSAHPGILQRLWGVSEEKIVLFRVVVRPGITTEEVKPWVVASLAHSCWSRSP